MIQLFCQAGEDRLLARRIFANTITCYLIALICALLLLPVVSNYANTLARDAVSAIAYVAVVVVVAGLTAHLQLSRFREPRPLPHRAFMCEPLKVSLWLPPVFVLITRGTVAGLLAEGALTISSATLLRRCWEPLAIDTPELHPVRGDAFSLDMAELSRQGMNRFGLTLMVCGMYCGLAAWTDRNTALAVLCVAASCFYLGWSREGYFQTGKPSQEVPTAHLFLYALLAIAVTFVGLLPSGTTFLGLGSQEAANHRKGRQYGTSDDQLHSAVILLPIRKASLVFVPPHRFTQQKPVRQSLSKTTTILFSGEYWFFRRPATRPSSTAFREQGDPTSVEVTLEDFGALVMEARQNIDKPVNIHCCRSINLVFNDEEKDPTNVDVELILRNSSRDQHNAQALGVQPLPNGPIDLTKSATLRFAVPDHSSISSFNQIVVWFYLKGRHRSRAAAVSIDRFDLIP
jgi:hypothetical protein